ncbi:MAG: 2-octaprenyl-6-methoxyphenyl hydroxylase [Gammaproteobacteria bacterium]|uniref:2-octaprenyl-6-methoxyphenyl hydroxylase n=1 Tax=Pseudomaricurvus alcaniphilus TaxID=1166482 RepID=UPI00140D4343|nr:2-octaprenyl-6-methoxyphenyl hydroxylase [Pseudomaricurvus alcaniphilus]MBR9912239.1 2-octaprenyl-6-methoxyphenyl hydroxylase [Gammaproteobacteria bacterium]NHN38697.1 2-octaprenyl-6-methoxyphenyl hydroxylase [Pseudomaricurvus alcaniphilus]
MQTHITIVGGGMVGAALAALLAAANERWQIALVEAFAPPAAATDSFQPGYDERSTAIAHGSVELLQLAGVWPQLARFATPIKRVHVSDRGHLGGALIDRQQLQVEALGYVVPNAWIGRVLLAHLQGLANISLLAPATVRRLQPRVGGVELQVERDGEEVSVHSELAVVADGANSGLRQSLGIDVDRQDYQQTAIIANISYELPHQGVAYERFTDAGPLAMLPLGGASGQQSALVWTHPSDRAEAVMALDDEQFLELLQQRFGYRLGRLLQVGRRDSYPLSLSVAREQIRSSIVLMGNAAHFLHPVAGQGFNLALRDCAALATCLQQAGADQPLGSIALLQQYQCQQQLDQQTTIGFSDQLTKLFSSTGLPQAALRGLGFFGLECLPPAKGMLARQTMGNASRRVIL